MGTLSLIEPLAALFPGGELKRGTTLQISGGVGITSLGLAIASAPAQAGSWVAVMGHRSLGLAAAMELGLPLERLVLVGVPERRVWATAAAALIDAFDLVLVFGDQRVNARDARRLAARTRERSNVLLRLGGTTWPEPADLRLNVEGCQWHGLGRGHGALRARLLRLVVTGRGAASRPRRASLWLPDVDGRIRLDQDSVPFGEVEHDRAVLGRAVSGL